MPTLVEDRFAAIHLLRAGHTVDQVAQHVHRTPRWVRKWRKRFETEGWPGLLDRSRAPKVHGRRLPDAIRQLVVQTRSELEAEAALGAGLKYIGGIAIRTRLKSQLPTGLPSVPTIERIIRERGLTRPRQQSPPDPIVYPHLQPTQPHQLCQADIVPHFLTGGERVACFNALDVVSRHPTGQAYAQRRSQDAAAFFVHVWQTLGVARYTQVDNEGCFCGGFTHPYVLGKVVRLALYAGTELVFSPVRHPQSNGNIERFHQDYDQHVWEDTYLESLAAVQHQADHFFQLYRHSPHHSRLQERTPFEVHHQTPPRQLPADFQWSQQKLPLYEGRIHFMRCVLPDATVSVLNAAWAVPNARPNQGVWVTIELRCAGATLAIYDAAPDAPDRTCLVTHDFPLSEPVQAHPATNAGQTVNRRPLVLRNERAPQSTVMHASLTWASEIFMLSEKAARATFKRTTRLAVRLLAGTM